MSSEVAKYTNIKIKKALRKKLKLEAVKRNKTLQDLLEEIVKNYLK